MRGRGKLGATPLTVFRRVTLPLMQPGIVAATALSFLVSFDEVVITLFLAGPQVTTLPVELFRYVETRSDPLVAATSVVLIALTLVVVFIGGVRLSHRNSERISWICGSCRRLMDKTIQAPTQFTPAMKARSGL